MKKSSTLSRSYLETLSSIELIRIADEYGIDIPDDLNRQFIIGDLLELAEELEGNAQQKETIMLSDEEEVMNVDTLPQSYNETRINVLLRNPVSLFVWWDLGENALKNLETFGGKLRLAVYFFKNAEDEKPSDTFGIQISAQEERAQYVIIPAGKKYVRVDLIGDFENKTDPLAFSPMVKLPETSQVISFKPGKKLDISPIMELSGAADLLREHYNEYRQSFY